MSIQAITYAMALREVSPSEKLLLLALANYADEHMRCFPSQRRLAEDTCLSDRTIRSLLSALEARRMITRQERTRQDGSRGTDVVTLNFAPAQISGGAEMVSGGVGKQFPGGAEMVSGLTTFEPSPEPSIEPLERAKGATKTRGSRRAPESWSPTEGHFAQATDEGFSSGEIEREIAKFRDHEFAKPHTDWNAAFRNWIRTAAERRPRKAHDRPDHNQRPTAREDGLRAHHAGAVAALNKRIHVVG